MDIYFNNTLIYHTTVQCSVTLPKRIDYYTAHKVNDEVRGYLVFDGTWNFIPPCSVQKTFKIQKLALILESPHINEYQPNSFIPIGPARGTKHGTAGYSIDHYLVNRPWIQGLHKQFVYEVYIMNSIQYQCSAVNYISTLTKMDAQLRNNIFEKMWNFKQNNIFYFKNDLINRICSYMPDKLVNCCTGMTTNNTGNVLPQQHSLAYLVGKAIPASFQGSYSDYHPATLGKKQWK